MTAALVSEHRLGRQSSVLSPWRDPQARCTERMFFLRRCINQNQFTIFVSIDLYIPTLSSTLENRRRYTGNGYPFKESSSTSSLSFPSSCNNLFSDFPNIRTTLSFPPPFPLAAYHSLTAHCPCLVLSCPLPAVSVLPLHAARSLPFLSCY